MAETIEPIGKDLVPFWPLTENYKVWVPDFVNMEKAMIQYQELKAESEKIKKAPRTRADQVKILKKAYSDHCEKIVQQLVALMSSHGADTFNRLLHMQNNPCNSFIDQNLFEVALEQLPPDPPDAMSEDQKRKKNSSIEKKMSELKSEIKSCSPQQYFMLRNGNIMCDSRIEFVRFWRDKQAWITKPCNPRGFDLELCPDSEKWAYEKLGIAKSILTKATKLPYQPQ